VADKDVDAKETSKVVLFVYKVSCKNCGFSKDSLLTETSDFAILVGQELQEEVCTLSYMHITLSSLVSSRMEICLGILRYAIWRSNFLYF
jgi:endoribonuclease Dicer